MKLRNCLFLSLFLFFATFSFGQKRYLFHNYTTRDGLINNGVFSMNQDRYGYIWFATSAGVSRFDGYKFDNNVIPEINKNGTFSQCAGKDNNGNLVFTSFCQGLLIEQPNGSFKQYLAKKPGVGRNITRTIKTCGNKLMVSSGTSVSIFENGKYKVIYNCKCGSVACNTIECDVNKNIWFGGTYGLAVMFASDTTYSPYFIPELEDIFVMNILFVSENELLVGTQTGYYSISFKSMTKEKLVYTIQQPIKELKETYINHVYKDMQSNIWISTMTNGVFKIRDNKILDNISVANGLINYNVALTFQDREGNYWFATSNGVSKLISFDNYGFAYNDKLISGVTSTAVDKYKRLWLWNESNLFVIAGTKVNKIDISGTSFAKNGIYGLQESKKGEMFIWNGKGLYNLLLPNENINLKNAKLIIDLLKYDIGEYFNIYEDENRVIVIGSDNGIFAYKNGKVNKCKFIGQSDLDVLPLAIEKDKYGYYWFGDRHYGLYRMKMITSQDNTVNFDSVLMYRSLKPDSAFVTAYAGDVYFDHDGNLWMSSFNTGIYKLTIDKTGVKNYKLYSMKDGLTANYINISVEDDKHNIWLTTDRGANCIVKQKNGRDTVLVFDSKNGLGDEVFGITPLDSIVYVSYAEGLYAINNSSLSKIEKGPPPVLITSISVMGKIDSIALNTKENYHLRYNQNFISFDFASISFSHENGMLYKYRLEGLDKDWGPYSDRRFVSYNSLSPGKYIFRVKAMAKNGLECNEETIFSLIISPPVYKTWWFILLAISVIISVIYFVYQYRLKQLLKIERLRTRIASDLHDDVGSTLSSISILSEILSMQLDNSPKSAEMISKIGLNARNMLESMDDIIWAVNPSNDKFQNLGLRIREYAIPLFESKNIKFHIHAADTLALLHLPMDVRRNVYLIAKEAINNLVKYSDCQEATIEFAENHSHLIMTISDNGKGFDPDSPSSRNGLKNMKRRAEQLNARIDIHSEPGKGSNIRLQVKII